MALNSDFSHSGKPRESFFLKGANLMRSAHLVSTVCLVCLVSFASAAHAAATAEFVLNPSADAYVTPNATFSFNGQSGDSQNAADPQGTADDTIHDTDSLWVARHNQTGATDGDGDGQADGDNRSFLKFDLSGFTDANDIQDATLRLFLRDADPNGAVSVRRVTDDWNTSNLLYSESVDPTSLGTIVTQEVNDPTGFYYELDLTSLVQDWVDGTFDNFGLRLSGSEGFNGTFRGFDSSTGLNPPQLVVTANVPEPSTLVLLALGLSACAVGAYRRRRRE